MVISYFSFPIRLTGNCEYQKKKKHGDNDSFGFWLDPTSCEVDVDPVLLSGSASLLCNSPLEVVEGMEPVGQGLMSEKLV